MTLQVQITAQLNLKKTQSNSDHFNISIFIANSTINYFR